MTQSHNSEWPEFVYPPKWEANEDFMAVHFYPKTEGMEEQWKSQMEFWTECISDYARQRLRNHRFSTRLSFTFDQIIRTYTSRKGTKPYCLEDVITDLIIDSRMMPITDFLVEPSVLNSIVGVTWSLGRWLSGSRPTLQKDIPFVYLPALKEFGVQFHQFVLDWVRNNPDLESPVLFESQFDDLLQSYFGTFSLGDKQVCERVLQNASRLIIKTVEEGEISQKVYKFSGTVRSNVSDVNETDMHTVVRLDLKQKIVRWERKCEEIEMKLKSEQIRVAQLVKGKNKATQIKIVKHSNISLYRKYLDNLRAKIMNLTQIILSIEEAHDNHEIFQMYKQGHDALSNLTKMTKLEDVEHLKDQLQEQHQEVENTSNLLAEETSSNMDVEAEYLKLVAQQTDLEVQKNLDLLNSMPLPPQNTVQQPKQKADVRQKEMLLQG